jgi:hypothetical protein
LSGKIGGQDGPHGKPKESGLMQFRRAHKSRTDDPGQAKGRGRQGLMGLSLLKAALPVLLLCRPAAAQYPEPRVKQLSERSGLLMRFVGTREYLPEDPLRDNFYELRYADRGLVKHPNGVKDQGLYGVGWKSACTESVYPFFYGSPGSAKVKRFCLPWHRSLRFAQGEVDFFRPVGMYYSMGSYVPIYDFDPFSPGPGPYPFPFYYNWGKGG